MRGGGGGRLGCASCVLKLSRSAFVLFNFSSGGKINQWRKSGKRIRGEEQEKPTNLTEILCWKFHCQIYLLGNPCYTFKEDNSDLSSCGGLEFRRWLLTCSSLMATHELLGNPWSIGTRNCRQPLQWPIRSIMQIRLKIRMNTDAIFRNCQQQRQRFILVPASAAGNVVHTSSYKRTSLVIQSSGCVVYSK